MADENSEQEAGAEVTEQTPDYESETVEQLEERMRAGEGIIRDDPPVEEVAPEVQAEPEVEPVAEEVEAPEAAEAELVAEAEVDEDFDEKQSLIEELQLKLEKEQINSQKIQHLQSRDAGMVGHLKKEMDALKQALTQPEQRQDEYYEAEPTSQPRQVRIEPGNDVLQSRLAELENTARAGAVEGEYQAFIAAKGIDPDKASEFMQSMAPSIKEQWEPYREQLGSMGAPAIKKSLRFVLDSAYADYRLAELKTKREAALERRASQVPERKKAKLASATAGSGTVSGAPDGPKRVSEMTAEEADAELIRLSGSHARSGRMRTG